MYHKYNQENLVGVDFIFGVRPIEGCSTYFLKLWGVSKIAYKGWKFELIFIFPYKGVFDFSDHTLGGIKNLLQDMRTKIAFES